MRTSGQQQPQTMPPEPSVYGPQAYNPAGACLQLGRDIRLAAPCSLAAAARMAATTAQAAVSRVTHSKGTRERGLTVFVHNAPYPTDRRLDNYIL